MRFIAIDPPCLPPYNPVSLPSSIPKTRMLRGYETIVWTYYDDIVVGKADITRQFAVQNIVVNINNRYQFIVSV